MTLRTFKFTLSFLLLAGLLSACNSKKAQQTENTRKRVVGYVAGYRDFDFNSIAAEKLTHINYAFANIVDGKVAFDSQPIDGKILKSEDVIKMQELKKKNPDLKILVSVGGWTWSGGFSDAALTAESRSTLARSAADFVLENKLDGIDFDWEYPNQRGAGNTHRVEDIENFTLLMKACREALDELGKKTNKHYLLTIATGADDRYIQNTQMGEVQKYLDFVNIMTYDFYNGHHNATGHHANLFASDFLNKDHNSVEHAVKIHLEAGIPKDKLNVGIPFYGRLWKGVEPNENHGLFSNGRTSADIIYYRTIKENYLNDPKSEVFWDEKAQVPYLYNPTDSVFISFENARSIALKVDYIEKIGLSGVMFWEYSDDYNQELLNAIGL
ncbi:MAG: glycoside hydrolase family 18 protein [Mangrovibacterium sp.]